MKRRNLSIDFKLFLFIVIALVAATIAYIYNPQGSTDISTSTDSTSVGSYRRMYRQYSADDKPRRNYNYSYPEREVESFSFDPNTADSTTLLRLGLAPYQVRGIYKYRAKGGEYHQKEDFARVPGLTVGDYRRLEPYIQIGEAYMPAAQHIKRPSEVPLADTINFPRKIDDGQTIELNTADTLTLRRIPGIGLYYARQILKYRKQLGGFTSVDQLMEIDEFPERALEYVRVDAKHINKININTASNIQLRRHPYIGFYRARRIMELRRLYGSIKSLSQLLPSPEFDEKDIRRLAPYIEF